MDLSIIIPLYNEDESLPELHDWIKRVMEANNFSYEVIFVDDGMIHLTGSADELRNQRGKSIDEIFREEFRC